MNIEVKPAATAYKLLIEKDVDVPMRDGARLKADVFRPDDGGKFPAILNLGPYQKDKLWVPPPTLEEKATPNMNWETVTPEWWVPKGYAAVRVDGRGSGKSPGQCEPWSLAEAVDFYDAIEWAAAQPWCNGKVGLSGISYYAINQWFVANLQPPSLKAIIPWEGFADIYRDALLPRRHPQRVHDQLVHRAPDAPHAWAARRSTCRTAGRPTRCGTGCTTTSTAARCAARRRSGTGSRCRCCTVGNWTGFGAASARQHRGVHARRLEAQEAAHPHRLARASVLHRGRQARSAPLLRLLAQGHRQRRDGRAAGQARDPQGQGRDRMAPRARMAAQAHAMDQVLFRPVEGRADGKEPRAGALVAGRSRPRPAPAPIRRSASARWARPRRPRRR